jgi:crotonobetainyl-CoA:carnitine CoA-transferase CaiB-like acyl-CoA transferase
MAVPGRNRTKEVWVPTETVEEPAELPLEGVRVVELAGGIAAAFATRQLAGYGADVVRVEGVADGPPLTADEATYLAAGKRRVDAGGVDLRALVLAADILVEEGRPGRLDRLGLAPAELRAAKPSLVITSISPFGQTGPYRHYKATNIVSYATGGFMTLTGNYDREPLVTGGSQAEYFGGLHAFAATATTYLGAVRHGEGDWIDLSLQECAAGTIELYGAATASGGPVMPRMGNQTRSEWGIYPCVDGYTGIFTLQRQVPNLFRAMDDPELTDGPYLDPTYRLEHPEELAAKLYVFTMQHTMAEMMDIGRRFKVPIGVAVTPSDLLAAAGLVDRDFWDDIETPEGTARVPGRPFAGLGWRHLEQLHEAGEDTDAVMKEWLEGKAS